MSDKKKKNSAKTQSDFIRFMVLTGLGGLLILLLTLVIVSSLMTKKDTDNKENESTIEKEIPIENKETGQKEEVIGIITKDAGNNTVQILNIETDEAVVLQIEHGTEMKDIYGQSMSLREFKIGDMIQTKYDKGSKVPEFLRISGEAWEQKYIKDAKIDVEAKTIEIGNNIYSYTNNLISMYKGEPISLDKIEPVDELTIRGYKNKAWFINVELSHGYLSVISTKEEEGIVEIDNGISILIKEAKNIAIAEGSHKVVIKKEGFEPIAKNIQVESMQNIEIDIGEMKKKVGQLQVIAKGVSDYKVFINDIEYPGDKAILLEYGDYHLTVKKEGYKDWNNDLKINQETKIVNVELEKEEVPQIVKVSIDTNPTGAEVYIDDIFIGITPLEEPIPYGEHKISLIKQGYSPLHIPISLNETQKERNLLFTLQKAVNEEQD